MNKWLKILLIAMAVLVVFTLIWEYQFVIMEKAIKKIGTYNIDYMDLEVTYDPEEEKAHYQVTMEIKPASSRPRSFLLYALSPHLEVKGAQINGQKVNTRNIWAVQLLRVPREYREEGFSLALQYEGGYEPVFDRSPGYLTASGAYLDILSLWQPLVLGPYLENFRDVNQVVRLNSPDPFMGVTGGDLIEIKRDSENTQTLWQSGILSSLVFKPFEPYSYPGSRLMTFFLPREHEELGEDLAHLSEEIFARYQEKLGPAGPENMTLAVVDSSQRGTFYPDGLVLINRNSLEQFARNRDNRNFYTLLAHEIGHYWFHFETISLTNMWGGQWYLEGFTEFMAIWSSGQRFGELEYDNRIRNAMGRLRSAPTVKPLIGYSYLEYSPVPYYKSVLMLDGIRRSYGEDILFEFIREVRNSPEVNLVKSMELSAEKIFHENYSFFFRHWLQGTTPVDLFIEDIVIDGYPDELMLVVTSNQWLDHMLDIAIEYPWGTQVINPRIRRGTNELVLPLEENYLSIELDPYRRLFRLNDEHQLRLDRGN